MKSICLILIFTVLINPQLTARTLHGADYVNIIPIITGLIQSFTREGSKVDKTAKTINKLAYLELRTIREFKSELTGLKHHVELLIIEREELAEQVRELRTFKGFLKYKWQQLKK